MLPAHDEEQGTTSGLTGTIFKLLASHYISTLFDKKERGRRKFVGRQEQGRRSKLCSKNGEEGSFVQVLERKPGPQPRNPTERSIYL